MEKCLVYACFFKHLSLSMFISFTFKKKGECGIINLIPISSRKASDDVNQEILSS